jgi:AAA15 family ATPase/GTPase
MIDSIKIERFRCFNETELSGFRRLNLFGGKNNAGKTSLLEAIYLGLTGNKIDVQNMRSKNDDKDSETYLHYQGQTNNDFKISVNDFKSNQLFRFEFRFNNPDIIFEDGTQIIKSNFVLGHHSVTYPAKSFLDSSRISFIHAKDNQFPIEYNLSQQFNEADRRGESDEILNSIKLIDNSIDELKTYSDRSDIFLRKKGEKHRLPLPYFGDALQKMMRYAITAATLHSENGSSEIKKYLLIDEIENGLHYTVHDEFWEMLFKLAIAYDIQIFSATHSREMIEAFNRISQKDAFKGEAAYFELFKHVKTGEIAGHIIEAEVLDYKLKNNKSLRGE